jgi:hypothetical protein
MIKGPPVEDNSEEESIAPKNPQQRMRMNQSIPKEELNN